MTDSGSLAFVDDADGQARHLKVGQITFSFDNQFNNVDVIYQRDALYLLELTNGEIWCGFAYAWLHTESGTPRLSDEFGSCNEVERVWSDDETISVSIWAGEWPKRLVDIVYDGTSLRWGTSSYDRGAWRDRHPSDAFLDAQLREPLQKLLGDDRDAVWEIFDNSTMVSFFDPEEDWLVATAIEGQARALLAPHQIDGRVVVSWRRNGSEPELRGEPDDLLQGILLSELHIP